MTNKQYEFNGSTVMIMTCSNCNTRCEHCYIGYSGNFDGNKLYDLCVKLKKRYNIILNGTEVLIHPEYFPSLELLKQPKVLTNGIAIENEPNILDTLIDCHVNTILLSYHFGIHDKISKVEEDLLKHTIGLIQSKGLNVKLMVTITQDNYTLIDVICKNVIQMGVHEVKFTNCLRTGNAKNLPNNFLTQEQINIFLDLLEKARKTYPKSILNIERCGTFGKNASNNKFKCIAGTDIVAITPDLKVYPCNFLARPGYEIGYVSEDDKIIISKPPKHLGNECLSTCIYNFNHSFSEYF